MDVLIILGSKSDIPIGDKIQDTLKNFKIDCKLAIASAHRTPDIVIKLTEKSDAKIFIAVAGMSAALPGFIASHTCKPVIGVPVSGKVNLDSILSVSQMPTGVPVAAVGLDSGENAALLAVEILAINDKRLTEELKSYRLNQKEKVLRDSKEVGWEHV